MSSPPLVSVLMTVYNREKYIAEAIESVLNSTYTNFELLIVDDLSTDQSLSIAKEYEAKDKRIKIIVNEVNLGQFQNRNKAATLAKGKYIKYVDSDDIIYDFGLSVLTSALELYPQAAIAIASQDTHPTEFKYPKLVSSREAFKTYFFNDVLLAVGPSGTMFRKEAFHSVGGYTGMHATADTELMLNLAANFPVVRVQPSFFYYRIHNEQVLTNSEKINSYVTQSYKFKLDALNSLNCPLDENEIKEAKQILKMKSIKIGLYQIIKKRRLNLGLSIIKNVYKN
jgi:glycosyltransferase involved in cell wall biosynthesis